jgi:UDP-GlcNAc:undecaprenyl-phosphate GlcNAc-1-phosphate transferase
MLGLYATSLALSAAAAAAAIVGLESVARRIGLVDRPGGRKDHSHPTPVVGGVGIALGVIPATLMFVDISPPVMGLILAGLVLLIVGVLDDMLDLPWQIRILAQIGAALIMIYVGEVRVDRVGIALGMESFVMGWVSTPLTVIATVGVINALNMIDGVDGLAGSQLLTTLAMLCAASVYSGNHELLLILLVMSGSTLGFIIFNFRSPWGRSAKVFLGNSGSALVGLLIAWTCYRLTQDTSHPVTPVLAPFLVALPIIDCLVLLMRRMLHGRSPFHADRTHFHHLLLAAGFSRARVVITLCAASMIVGLSASLLRLFGLPTSLFPVLFIGLVAMHFAFTWNPDRAVRILSRFA